MARESKYPAGDDEDADAWKEKGFRPFDRALWLKEEMCFEFVHRISAFVNFELEKACGDPDHPHHRISLTLVDSKTSTGVFQHAILLHINRARERKRA